MKTQPINRFSTDITLAVDADHSYTVKSPPYEVGRYLVEYADVMAALHRFAESNPDAEEMPTRLADRLQEVNDDAPADVKADPIRAALGDALDEMLADGVGFPIVKIAAATVAVWVRTDIETAVAYWNNGGRVENPTNRATRRQKTKKRS